MASSRVPTTGKPTRWAATTDARIDMDIRPDDLSSAASQALLRLHLEGMHANSPPGHVFALDYSGLKAPDVTVWTVWEGNDVCGIGALRQIDAHSAEVKSMRTHPDHVRRGIGTAILEHIIVEARRRGVRRLSLETGSGPAFDAALALYRKHGFVSGGPFDYYAQSEFNQFLHLELDPGSIEVANRLK
jgi:putative acetyltransferase